MRRALDLPNGGQLIVDEMDWPLVSALTVYRGTNGYAYYSVWENGRSQPRTLHSLLIGTHKGMHVDHINGDKLDNRSENLRIVTPQVNQINRKNLNRNNRSGFRGVDFDKRKGRWRAQITVARKNRFLGYFDSPERAAEARRAAEADLWPS